MPFRLEDACTALIVGAGHGIGYATLQALSIESPHLKIWGTYQNPDKASELLKLAATNPNIQTIHLDLHDDADIQSNMDAFIEDLSGSPLDLCLIATGVLHDESMMPEKSLSDVKRDHLLKYFEVNSVVAPLIAKHLKPIFSKETESLFACLSAKVGSISDNGLGGWYGYRASKAALNMFVKTMSVEFKLAQLKTIVLSIHPGTTKTGLSSPFLSHIKHTVFTQQETANHLINIFKEIEASETGHFKNWDGQDLPW